MGTFGVDVLDPAVTPRRLGVLLERLPPGSWPDQHSPASWSAEAYLLAALIDAVQWNTYATLLGKTKARPAKPKAMPRPGQRNRIQGQQMSVADLARRMAATGKA